MNGNGNLSTKLPVFDGKNWICWMILMCVLFGAQDILDLVNESYAIVAADTTKAQRNTHRETRKKDQKTMFYIHQCVDLNVFGKIIDLTITKDVETHGYVVMVVIHQ